MRRHLILFLIAASLLILPGQAAQHTHKIHHHHSGHHSQSGRLTHSWDPGYTYQNPFGLPRWARRPVQPR